MIFLKPDTSSDTSGLPGLVCVISDIIVHAIIHRQSLKVLTSNPNNALTVKASAKTLLFCLTQCDNHMITLPRLCWYMRDQY